MKKLLSILTMALLVMSVMPMVLAVNTGTDVGIDISTKDSAPELWLCDRSVADDLVEPQLYGLERYNNYAFEGESITWTVLVKDENGREKIDDVYATMGPTQGEGNDIEVNCQRIYEGVQEPYRFGMCGATDLNGDDLVWNNQIMGMYECTLTVETSDSMQGEYFVTVEAEDNDELVGTMANNEYWFLNPVISLSVDGDLAFEDVVPGNRAYSETILLGNDAEDGSGVIYDVYVSGTNFYDSTSSGAMCPTSNVLDLSAFTYDVVNGQNMAEDMSILPGDTIAQAGRIMDGQLFGTGSVNEENFLAPGAEMALTFQLDLPSPCNGDFDTGSIYFWAEAI